MGLFVFSEEDGFYTAKTEGVEFVCEAATPELEKALPALAQAYWQRLPELVAFILNDITDFFGEMTEEELSDALGTPQVDLDREAVVYLEHTLDNEHIIEVEYGGLFDKFYEVTIDG